MLNTGTAASRTIKPAGFLGGNANHARGHLISRLLGGSGKDPRNLATIYQNPVNTPIMRGFEQQVANAVRAGETVKYTVTPIYRGTELIPRAFTLRATGSGVLPPPRLDPQQGPVSSLDELTALVPPPEDPSPVAASEIELPADYMTLIERYGLGNLAGLRLLPPADILYEAVRQRAALLDIETPYAPEDLLPWGIDESGNVVWWLTETDGDWPVVANEARGEEWHRHDGGAVSFLTDMLSGRETSDFLVIEGDDFEPYSSSERPG